MTDSLWPCDYVCTLPRPFIRMLANPGLISASRKICDRINAELDYRCFGFLDQELKQMLGSVVGIAPRAHRNALPAKPVWPPRASALANGQGMTIVRDWQSTGLCHPHSNA